MELVEDDGEDVPLDLRAAVRLRGTRVTRRCFDAGRPRARVPGTNMHASRPFREMIARRTISRKEWKPTERGAL